MTHARILALALICAWVARGQATCAANGLTLSTSGGRLGDPVSLSLTGTPFASGLFGYDPAPGPVATPIGTLCIGLSPALQTAPFVLDPAGTFAVAGTLPANPAFAGITYFLQAAAQDLSQPVGFALSNSSVMKLRQPRLFLLSPGGYLPPQGVPVPGSMRRVDALTDVVSPLITLMGMLQGAVAVRDLDWVVTAEMVGGVPKLVAYDAGTLAVAQSSVLPAAAGYPNGVYAAGTRVYVACTAGVVAYQLPSMAPQFVTPVPGAWGVFLPGGAFGYVALPTSIVPFDLVTGVASPAINVSGPGFGSAGAWTVGGGVIYVGLWGGIPAPALRGINGVDTNLNAPLFPSPVPLPVSSNPTFIQYGPGSTGPSVFLGCGTPTVLQLSPSTLLTTATIPMSISTLDLSNGGTEWLFVAGGQVQSMNPATLAITLTGVLAPPGRVVPLPSASINKAFVYSAFLSLMLTPLTTDPTTTGAPAISIPMGFGGYTVLVID